MSKVTFSVACSLDGYQTDFDGSYAWAKPTEEVIAAINDDARNVSTYLYGRHAYAEMASWETDTSLAEKSAESARFAEAWKAADKIVFSRSLGEVWTERTRLEKELTPEALEAAKAEASGDLTLEGPLLARSALSRGLIDEVAILLCPVVVGGGGPVFPTGMEAQLSLVDEKRFENGMLRLRYALKK